MARAHGGEQFRVEHFKIDLDLCRAVGEDLTPGARRHARKAELYTCVDYGRAHGGAPV